MKPLAAAALLAGAVAVGLAIPALGRPLGVAVDAFVALFTALAPFLIFFTLTPALVAIASRAQGRGLAVRVFGLLAAGNAAAVLVAVLLGLPFFPPALDGPSGAATSPATALAVVSTSQAFLAVVWSLASAALLLAFARTRIARATARVLDDAGRIGLAALARALVLAMPALLLLFGATLGARAATPQTVGGTDPLRAYAVSLALTAAGSTLWIALAAVLTARVTHQRPHSLLRYVGGLAPFTLATASSAAALPLNVTLTRDTLGVDARVASLAVPLGVVFSRAGTAMSATFITLAAASAAGATISLGELALAGALVWLLMLAVPGIPGGIGATAPPVLAAALGLTGATASAFVALWFAFLLGLGDSFRTTANTVSAGFAAALAEGKLEKREPHPDA
ncbi:MAG: cation:dicarboxylate symporter family transporter [Thermoplasmatota archaeon]